VKLKLEQHRHGFYISNEKILVNVPERFMFRDPFQEVIRFLHLLGFELEIKKEKT